MVVIVRICLAALVVGAFLVLTQTIQIFPAVIPSLFLPNARDEDSLPAGVRSHFAETEDGELIEVWRYPAPNSKYVAIVFHGNGQTVDHFFAVQEWLHRLGITSYGFDYRGYGYSSGWPTEEGLYLDSKAVWNIATELDSISKDNAILIGMSIGSAPAAFLAKEHNVNTLVLFSPYRSITQLVNEHPFLRYLSLFLWFSLPTQEFLGMLSDTAVIITHGARDTIIPFSHGEHLAKSLGVDIRHFVISKASGHNDLFFNVKDDVGALLLDVLKSSETGELEEVK